MTQYTKTEFENLATTELPFMRTLGIQVEELNQQHAILSVDENEEFLRPGGTISGPVMMALADAAFYAVTLANIGEVKLAVTTNLNINFLRKPPPGKLMCKASILKLGKRLVVCECSLYSNNTDHQHPVAHATGTYSIPAQ